MMVVLKIPIAYLCAVVWWAVKAEPRPLEGATLAGVREPLDGPDRACPWLPRRRGPRRGPDRTAVRSARRSYARTEARR